jgi:hypothetical protein
MLRPDELELMNRELLTESAAITSPIIVHLSYRRWIPPQLSARRLLRTRAAENGVCLLISARQKKVVLSFGSFWMIRLSEGERQFCLEMASEYLRSTHLSKAVPLAVRSLVKVLETHPEVKRVVDSEFESTEMTR